MEGKRIIGIAALALIAVAALSVVGTFAYPGIVAATGATSCDCDGELLQARFRIQDRTCDGNGTMARETAQIQTQSHLCGCQGVDCNATQSQSMQQSQECLAIGGQPEQITLQARNQIMAQVRNGRP